MSGLDTFTHALKASIPVHASLAVDHDTVADAGLDTSAHAITNLETTSEQQSPAETGARVTIDHTTHTHIIDAIIQYSTRDALNVLRLTSKEFQTRVSDILDTHVAIVYLGDTHIPAIPEDMDSWPEDLTEEEKKKRRLAAMQPRKVDFNMDSIWGDRVVRFNVARLPPMSPSVIQRTRTIDIHCMPDPRALSIIKRILEGPYAPKLETIRLIGVNDHQWGGECPIAAPTFVVFIPTSPLHFAELDDMLFPPQKGIEKLVLNMVMFTPVRSFVEPGQLAWFTRVPDTVKEVVFIFQLTDKVPATTAPALGIAKQDVFSAMTMCIAKGFHSKSYTIVGLPVSLNRFMKDIFDQAFPLARGTAKPPPQDSESKKDAAKHQAAAEESVLDKIKFLSQDEYRKSVGRKNYRLHSMP